MTARAARRQRWIAAHCEQSRNNSCVPACAAMLQGLAQGLDDAAISRLESDYIERWSPDGRGVPLGRVHAQGFHYQYEPDFAATPSDAIASLEDRLRDGPVIVSAWTGPLRHAQGGTGWRPSDRQLHAIALVGCERRRFLYLDPANPRSLQPLEIAYAKFLDAWTGELAVLADDR